MGNMHTDVRNRSNELLREAEEKQKREISLRGCFQMNSIGNARSGKRIKNVAKEVIGNFSSHNLSP